MIVRAVHLAEGIATDGWRVFGGSNRQHRIQRYRTGLGFPNVRFRADGATFSRYRKQRRRLRAHVLHDHRQEQPSLGCVVLRLDTHRALRHDAFRDAAGSVPLDDLVAEDGTCLWRERRS